MAKGDKASAPRFLWVDVAQVRREINAFLAECTGEVLGANESLELALRLMNLTQLEVAPSGVETQVEFACHGSMFNESVAKRMAADGKPVRCRTVALYRGPWHPFVMEEETS